MKILLLEDDMLDQKAFFRASQGLLDTDQIVTCLHVKACLEYLEHHQLPDLIISDLKLPGLPGSKLKQRLAENPRWTNIPVVILTTSSEPAEVRACYEGGASGYFCKPVGTASWKQLLKTIVTYWHLAERPPL